MIEKINLILAKDESLLPAWNLGDIIACDEAHPRALERSFQQAAAVSSASAWLFWDMRLGNPRESFIQEAFLQPIDIWHLGLRLGMSNQPGIIDFVAPTWMLNRDPDGNMEATSWRATHRACLVRSDVFEQIGFIRPEFQSLSGAWLEWSHRCITNGAFMRHTPALAAQGIPAEKSVDIPIEDELRFIYYRFGKRWVLWAAFRAIISGYSSPGILVALRKLLSYAPPPQRTPHILGENKRKKTVTTDECQNAKVSVLIPTIERYPYLKTLLTQLREQTFRAGQIIIVDQSPPGTCPEGFYQSFSDLPLQLIQLDKAGQCSSRNAGLQTARGDLILLLDDDVEISKTLIESHVKRLQQSNLEASCGVVDEIGGEERPKAFRLLRQSDVFPAGNSLIKKTALHRSGLFDLAYELGSRADGDLGMRLYLNGAEIVLDPEICVLHHHAPRGGLRTHGARVVTYGSSRKRLLHRDLPSVTELYLARRYFTRRQQGEMIWISVLGTFSLHASGWKKLLKMIVSLLLLPYTLWVIRSRTREVDALMKRYPIIPVLLDTQVKETL